MRILLFIVVRATALYWCGRLIFCMICLSARDIKNPHLVDRDCGGLSVFFRFYNHPGQAFDPFPPVAPGNVYRKGFKHFGGYIGDQAMPDQFGSHIPITVIIQLPKYLSQEHFDPGFVLRCHNGYVLRDKAAVLLSRCDGCF